MSGTAEVGNEAGKDSSAQKDTGESVTEEAVLPVRTSESPKQKETKLPA